MARNRLAGNIRNTNETQLKARLKARFEKVYTNVAGLSDDAKKNAIREAISQELIGLTPNKDQIEKVNEICVEAMVTAEESLQMARAQAATHDKSANVILLSGDEKTNLRKLLPSYDALIKDAKQLAYNALLKSLDNCKSLGIDSQALTTIELKAKKIYENSSPDSPHDTPDSIKEEIGSLCSNWKMKARNNPVVSALRAVDSALEKYLFFWESNTSKITRLERAVEKFEASTIATQTFRDQARRIRTGSAEKTTPETASETHPNQP